MNLHEQTAEDTRTDPELPGHPVQKRRTALWRAAVILALTTLATGGMIVALDRGSGSGSEQPGTPGEFSAEAGFARDMQVHHAQAVDMSVTIRDRSNDPMLRTVALDILTSQQQQLGQMYAWLELWGLPQTGEAEAMAWMADKAGTHHGMPGVGDPADEVGSAQMPGMATPDQLERLETTRGRRAEALWLRLLIRHHRAGVGMADAVLARTSHPEVRQLAQSMVSAQQSEIDQLRILLKDRAS